MIFIEQENITYTIMPQPDIIKVIVTDDHRLFRTGVKNVLAAREDIRVVGEAENGKQLLDLLETTYADLVILDLQMPIISGEDALPVLRERYPKLKIILSGMHSDADTICKTIELGAHAYVHKAAGTEELFNAILVLKERWFFVNRTVAEAFLQYENERNPVIPPQMSEKDKRFLGLLCIGHTEEQMARMLDLSPRTIAAIIDKLIRINGVKNKEELIQFGLSQI